MMAFVGTRASMRRCGYRGQKRAASGQGTNAMMSREVGVPACEGLAAFGRGEYARTIEFLSPLRSKANRFGGSHAQRDMFSWTLQPSISCWPAPASEGGSDWWGRALGGYVSLFEAARDREIRATCDLGQPVPPGRSGIEGSRDEDHPPSGRQPFLKTSPGMASCSALPKISSCMVIHGEKDQRTRPGGPGLGECFRV